MKKLLFCGLVAMVASTYTFAGCVGAVVNGQCMGIYALIQSKTLDPVPIEMETTLGMKAPQVRDINMTTATPAIGVYSTDLDAQRRDQMNLNPRRSLDRGM